MEEYRFGHRHGRNILLEEGPCIPVSVFNFLQAELPGCDVYALIDTGTTFTAINDTVAKDLELNVIDRLPIGSVHSTEKRNIYSFRLAINNVGSFFAVKAAGLLLPQTFRDRGIDVLIGRDTLSQCLMTYSGPESVLTLAKVGTDE